MSAKAFNITFAGIIYIIANSNRDEQDMYMNNIEYQGKNSYEDNKC